MLPILPYANIRQLHLLTIPNVKIHRVIPRNRNRKLQTSKAPLESHALGTSLFTSAASSQRGCPQGKYEGGSSPVASGSEGRV